MELTEAFLAASVSGKPIIATAQPFMDTALDSSLSLNQRLLMKRTGVLTLVV